MPVKTLPFFGEIRAVRAVQVTGSGFNARNKTMPDISCFIAFFIKRYFYPRTVLFGGFKNDKSTSVAFLEKTAKFTPLLTSDAPSGSAFPDSAAIF